MVRAGGWELGKPEPREKKLKEELEKQAALHVESASFRGASGEGP